MTDSELILGCLNNDRRCQNALYKKYFPLMSSISIRYSKSSDEVISKLNGGFFKVLQNLSKFNQEFALATFIRNVMVNYFIDEFRKEKKFIANVPLDEFHEKEAGIAFNDGESNLEKQELLLLLKQLPDVTGKVFNLFAIDGYKHAEIAIMLGVSIGTSKWHVNEARRLLKLALNKENKKKNTWLNQK